MESKNFLLEEYKSLKTEIFQLIGETRTLETYAAASVAALLAWFATQKLPLGLAWYIPIIIPVLAGIRAIALFWRVGEIASYLRDLERAFLKEGEKPSGWENHFQRHAQTRISPTAIIFWGLLLAVTILAPLILQTPPGKIPPDGEKKAHMELTISSHCPVHGPFERMYGPHGRPV